MPKNIVLLSDGTGNSAGKLSKTNVWKLYQALDLSDPDKQIALYDDGVGTSSFKPLAILGGAFGYGLKRNVLDLYTFLCRNYQPGDRIFCFGFSRGAFTVRSLSGLINCEGLVAAPTEAGLQDMAKTAFREYRRKRYPADIPLDRIGRAIRDMFVGEKHYQIASLHHERPEIEFLGVWDTVAAYGLPIDELTRALNWVWRLYPKDRNPPAAVKRICHALALDDERNTFHPMLYNEANLPGNLDSTHLNEERVSQVWFCGMHSDVGGGYPEDGLAGVPLKWMIEQAEARPFKLLLKPAAREAIVGGIDPLGPMHDSRRGVGGFYRYQPRKMSCLIDDKIDSGSQVIVARPKIHESVFQRIRKSGDRYSPIVLPPAYAVVEESGKIVDSASALEHPTQAENRALLQERIWDLVWWKRIAYFSSILVALLLATFPLYNPQTVVCGGPTCFVSPVIGWVGALLPGFTQPLLASYQSHPGLFLALAVAFAALLRTGAALQLKIFDGMRALWQQSVISGPSITPSTQPTSTFVYWLRTRPLYVHFFLLMKRHLLPLAFGLIAALVLLESTGRAVFRVMSSAGAVCEASGANGDVFDTTSPCWKVPHEDLTAGKNYKITLTAEPGPYQDNTIPTGLGGFGREKMPWLHPAALLLRRNLQQNWFKPMARIGEYGIDEYALNPMDGTELKDGADELTAVITARRDGPLFLYVNDAVLPAPNALQWFYSNNHAKIRVRVEELQQETPMRFSTSLAAPKLPPRF